MMEETGTDTLLKMFISNLTYQVLTKNYFNFNDQLFEQKQGTAMGTRMAPNYAVIFMHYLETNCLTRYPTPPKSWPRFINDIHDKERWRTKLKMFLEALNNYYPTIKFTYTMEKNEIAFLHTTVYRSPKHRIYTRIYHKPTDQKQYLHYHSGIKKNPLWPSHQMQKNMHRRPLI